MDFGEFVLGWLLCSLAGGMLIHHEWQIYWESIRSSENLSLQSGSGSKIIIPLLSFALGPIAPIIGILMYLQRK